MTIMFITHWPERDLGYGQKSRFTAALARHRLGPRPVIVFPYTSMIRVWWIVTLTTLQQLNSYHRIVAWPQTDHLNEFFYLDDRHLLSLFGLGSWPPYPAANLHRKKYKCTGSHFQIPCLKTNTKYQIKIACICAAVVLPSSENNSFSMHTLINVQSVFTFKIHT